MTVKIPISNEVPKIHFPKFSIEKLGKTNIFFIEDNNQDILKIGILNRAGSAVDTIPGISSITHTLLTYGTSTMNYEQISNAQEMLGASMNAYALDDSAKMEISVLSEFSEKAMDLLLSCYFDPSFSDEELQHVRERQISAIEHSKAHGDFLVLYASMKSFYVNHQYSRPTFGDKISLNSITKDDVLAFYNDYILTSEHAIYISGKFDKDLMLKKLTKFFDKGNFSQKHEIEIFSGLKESKIALIGKKDAVQANLEISSDGISLTAPDIAPLKIANIIFGGFFMSRLNEIIREKYGYTYGIFSSFRSRRFSNQFTISSSLNTDNLSKAINLINEIKTDFATKSVTDEEFIRAQRYFLGNFQMNLETHMQISNMLNSVFVNNLDYNYHESLLEKIANVKIEDVYNAQLKYFNPKNTIISVAGDLGIIDSKVQEFGTAQVIEFI